MRSRSALPLVCLVAAGCLDALPGQAAASDSSFLTTSVVESGGSVESGNYKVVAVIGAAPRATRATSPNFNLRVGYTGSVGARPAASPWLTGASPRSAGLNGGQTIVLRGGSLDRGGAPRVSIAGFDSPVNAFSRTTITTTLPTQLPPGPVDVHVIGAEGVTTSLYRGLDVAPVLRWDAPPRTGAPLRLRYNGGVGDLVFLVVAVGYGPPFSLPGFGYSLQVNPALLLGPPVGFTAATGAQTLTLPSITVPLGVNVQAFVLSSDPKIAPGAFSNVLAL
ncbi:MAG: hypothetical protein AAF628_10945 [Planctomycetota bacterium]